MRINLHAYLNEVNLRIYHTLITVGDDYLFFTNVPHDKQTNTDKRFNNKSSWCTSMV